MPPELSLVVDTVAAPDPGELVRSIDESTLPAARFELLLRVGGAAEAIEGPWQRLASRRPNVRVVAPGQPGTGDPEGDYVLALRADQRLFPDALTRLLDLALAHDLDAVAAREVAPGAALDALLVEDAVDAGAAADRLLAGPVVLRRRASTDGGGAARVGVLASYPATWRAGPEGSPAGAVTVVVAPPAARWQGSALELELAGQVEAVHATALRPVVLLHQLETALSYVLPGAADDVVLEDGSARWATTRSIDLRVAAAGSPLPPGEWQVEVALVGADECSAAVAVPEVSLPVALVDGQVVVVAGPGLVLDVGPTRRACPQLPGPEAATITESAAGCRLDVALDGWHVLGEEPRSATIALDRLRLPARVVPSRGSATLTAFISGLAGTYPLSLQLGRAPMQPTGLAVVISGDGAVTVTVAPPKPAPASKPAAAARPGTSAEPKPKPKPKPKPQPKPVPTRRPAPQPAAGPVARLRRAVPRSLEPQVHRLAEVPLLRRTYRRLTGLGGR
ncbi:hypothetical protein SAMN04488543_2143 [Friedmanniella luteola]|uniref:Uncharacterized protein n=1 Tax=Friedmanniella luteola TaxID=546871 RepID=A0A1H1U1W5_9ACTN|nr:hypothetical protein [Friedmanniella luteola]SDS66341.1 hypothetical protein SAMN04488543_2143 [Friedmanniella luteola]